jgi:signal transduction histidine kinase
VAEESRAEVQARLSGKVHGSYHLQAVRKDGTKFLVEATARTHMHNGKLVRVAVLRDLTERRHLEEQLRQAQKMEAVGQLTGAIAHDFNNLLTVITGFTEILIKDLEPGDGRLDDLMQVQKAADAAASLTRQLLAFSRNEVIQPKAIVLEEIVAQSTKLMRRLIGADIRVEATFSSPPSVIHMDPGHLEQVIMNLMVNARDAMPDGGRLSIATSVADLGKTGRYATLCITDSGIGMNRITRSKIFEPFFTTKPPDKGTGLGLATVNGIVRRSGGFIEVESEPGQGSEFKVYLPLFTDAPEPAEVHPAATGPQGSETILLVEDSELVRIIASRTLTAHGYDVIEASTARRAREIATTLGRPIHLLLTDIVMPDASGPALALWLVKFLPDVKVMFMSGYTSHAAIRNGLIPPTAPLLQKPFTAMSLATKVREVIDS